MSSVSFLGSKSLSSVATKLKFYIRTKTFLSKSFKSFVLGWLISGISEKSEKVDLYKSKIKIRYIRVFEMEVEERSMVRAILEDVKSLKGKVEGMEGMLETLVEIYTDVFYEVKEDYLKDLEEIRKERGKVFSSIGEFDRYFE